MFDIKWIKENPKAFDEAMKLRENSTTSQTVIELDEKRKQHVAKLQEAQTRRNAASKEIGTAMGKGDKDLAEKLKAEVADLKQFMQTAEEEGREIDRQVLDIMSALPNAPLSDVPVGQDENDNLLYRMHGEKPEFAFEPREHFEIGVSESQMDFEKAASLSGSRFVVLQQGIARLERALGQFMLDMHTRENGYLETSPPLLVRDDALFGTGQLPKFAEDLFKTTDGRWLIPTAEVPLTNLVREQILDKQELPLRLAALTPCFRSEAGSAGRDTRGMLRQHQFSKCELVSITKPEDSEAELERMLDCAENVLKTLGLHFRTMTLCTGDMGFSARKTYDIEVWLPGQNSYREISSCSVCGDFQARRMNARYREDDGKTIKYVHTLNGSGVATGRALIAVMENYQNEDGSITVPECLIPYMGGITKIEKA